MLISVGPNLPGLARSINPTGVSISNGARNLFTFDWLFGFVVSVFLYTVLSLIFPQKGSLVERTVYGPESVLVGVSDVESVSAGDAGERGGESVEEGKEHHGKDFGNVDAVDVGTEWHTHKHEKHMSEKSAVEKM